MILFDYQVIPYSDFLFLDRKNKLFVDTLAGKNLIDLNNPLKLSRMHNNIISSKFSPVASFDIPLDYLCAMWASRGIYGIHKLLRRSYLTHKLNNLIKKVCIAYPTKKIIFILRWDDPLILEVPSNCLILCTNIDNRSSSIRQMAISFPIFDDDRLLSVDLKSTQDPAYLFSFIGQSSKHRREIIRTLKLRSDSLVYETSEWWNVTDDYQSDILRQRMIDFCLKAKFNLAPEGGGYHVSKFTESWLLGRVPILVSPFLRLPKVLLDKILKVPLIKFPTRVDKKNFLKFNSFLNTLSKESYDPFEVRNFYKEFLSPNAIIRNVWETFRM
jgi:hypothetical protein